MLLSLPDVVAFQPWVRWSLGVCSDPVIVAQLTLKKTCSVLLWSSCT